MKAAWRMHSGERHAPPVEMRFVDMFMAALGALVFMAMLMAFLLRFYPRQEAPSTIANNGNDFKLQPFKLTTKTLPTAHKGELYEMVFAFQGGLPPATWEVSAGEGEIPAGLKFDAALGTLAGVPQKAGTARFVVKAKDQFGTTDSRPYELAVAEPVVGSRKIEHGLAIAMFLAVLVLWLLLLTAYVSEKRELAMFRAARARGRSYLEMEIGRGQIKRVDFDDGGIATTEEAARMMGRICWFFFFVMVVLGGWAAWRIWFS